MAVKKLLPTVGNTYVVVLDDDDDANLGPQIVEGKRSFQATADFNAGF